MAEALAGLLENRAIWSERRRTARAFVERDRNWLSNISRYEPVYQKLLGCAPAAKAA
jgi:glycosyltransferase involved in cell wall biosynthesis